MCRGWQELTEQEADGSEQGNDSSTETRGRRTALDGVVEKFVAWQKDGCGAVQEYAGERCRAVRCPYALHHPWMWGGMLVASMRRSCGRRGMAERVQCSRTEMKDDWVHMLLEPSVRGGENLWSMSAGAQ